MRLAARVHRWGGLLTAPFLLVLGLSGAVLVWAPEIEEAQRDTPALAPGAPARSLDALVAAALLAHPGGVPRALRAPARPDQPWRVELEVGPRRLDVAVDPWTLRVVGGRAPERSTLAAVHSLHAAFHAGRAGALLVGLLGLWLVVEGASGLWLYGPWSMRRVRVRGGSRGLHRVVGGLSLVLGVIVGLTGALLAAAAALAATAPAPPAGSLARLDAAAARAESALPGGRITALVAAGNPAVRVEMRLASGDTRVVMVDGERATVSAPPRARGWDLIRRAHAGDFAGRLSQVVYAAVGLALPLLSITGFVISARRAA